MGSWIDSLGAIAGFHDKSMASDPGTGASMAGQHAVTPAERQDLNTDLSAYQFNAAKQLQAKGGQMTATDDMKAAFRIGQASDKSHFTPADKEAYLQAAQKMPLGDVNDPEARMKAMSFITQDKPGQEGAMGMDGGTDKSVCAGASIVGAAFLAEGPEGLKAVMKHIESADPGKVNTSAQMNPEYAKLKAKLAKDPQSLTVEDIQLLQQTTYDVLQSRQQKDLKAKGDLKPGDVAPSGISNDTMDAFMKGPGGKDSDLQKMFDKNGMKIAFIDNDGSLDEQDHTAPDHYVVQMSNKDGKQAIYDPNARRGGQIIDFDDGVNLYNQATQDYIGDGKHGK